MRSLRSAVEQVKLSPDRGASPARTPSAPGTLQRGASAPQPLRKGPHLVEAITDAARRRSVDSFRGRGVRAARAHGISRAASSSLTRVAIALDRESAVSAPRGAALLRRRVLVHGRAASTPRPTRSRSGGGLHDQPHRTRSGCGGWRTVHFARCLRSGAHDVLARPARIPRSLSFEQGGPGRVHGGIGGIRRPPLLVRGRWLQEHGQVPRGAQAAARLHRR